MREVLDYLMDVKSGLLADAFADDRKLEFFKNHAKKTKVRSAPQTSSFLFFWVHRYEHPL